MSYKAVTEELFDIPDHLSPGESPCLSKIDFIYVHSSRLH